MSVPKYAKYESLLERCDSQCSTLSLENYRELFYVSKPGKCAFVSLQVLNVAIDREAESA
jgi:hypothetical protein